MNKYTKWYKQLIDKAVLRGWTKESANEYVEKHHILPRSLGGDNSKSNLVCLTAREHFIAHLLLSKMYIGVDKSKMQFALHMFTKNPSKTSNRVVNSTTYEYVKKCFAEAVSATHTGLKKPKSAEHRAKTSATLTGRKNPLIAEQLRGRKKTQETIDKAIAGRKGYTHSMETKEKLRQKALLQWAAVRESAE